MVESLHITFQAMAMFGKPSIRQDGTDQDVSYAYSGRSPRAEGMVRTVIDGWYLVIYCIMVNGFLYIEWQIIADEWLKNIE